MLARHLVLLLFFTMDVFSSSAQRSPKQYQFRRIDIGKGLSNNQVTCIFKDRTGFMWYGTMAGLNRYDGYKFKVFKHDPIDPLSIDDDYISRIMELPDGKLLIETRNFFNVYDPLTEKFSHNLSDVLSQFNCPNDIVIQTLKNQQGDFYILFAQQGIFKYNSKKKQAKRITVVEPSPVKAMALGPDGHLWLVHYNAVVEKIDGKNNSSVYSTTAFAAYMKYQLLYYTIFVDSQNELWMYAAGDPSPKGITNFKPLTGEITSINKGARNERLNTDIVKGITQDNEANIWICTDHGGINVYDKKNHTVQYLVNNSDDANSLSQNSITSVYKDNTGIIWIGTYKKGVNCYHENIIKFPLFRHQPSNPGSLCYDDVNRFAEDAKGNLWIGTNGGGLVYFDRSKGKFIQYKHQPSNPNSISSDVIVSLWIDRKQRLWIGSYYGGLDCYDGKTFVHYKHDPANPQSLADNRVWEIYEDVSGNLWVGTLVGGLDRFDREKNIFYHHNANMPGSIHSNFISSIAESREGNVWVGTASGLDVLEKKTGRFINYDYSSSNPKGLSNGNIICIFIDSRNRPWIGTREGLNLFNGSSRTFQHFTVRDGLPDNDILNILEDNNHYLWISTPKGITKVNVLQKNIADPVQLLCKNYDDADGLQGIEFNENAALKTAKGEIVFGGPNGFNIFQPQNIQPLNPEPSLVFTGFQVFNKTIETGEAVDGKILLPQAISQTNTLTLNYNQNVISLEFAALDFYNPDKIRYLYRLDGFREEWLSTDGRMRKALFTNLDPGSYTFRIRVEDPDGGWSKQEKQMQIIILPPLWRTPVAYGLYAIIIITAFYIGRQRIVNKTRQKFAIAQERQQAQQMHELDLMKIKFFTNVSHEFRTPLSLILTPLDKLLKQVQDPGHNQQLQMINRNARRLLNLVNQLLDFRKMEVQELKLYPRHGNIILFISDVVHFFSDVADKKNISFSFRTNTEELNTCFDHDKIERILFNLLSNAFKFTPAGGHVGVEVTAKQTLAAGYYDLQINVRDTGIGIEKEKHEKIFERFFQNDVPGSMVNQGSGIGLSITKEFVKLHGGSIRVESEANKGSCFIIDLSLPAVPLSSISFEKPAGGEAAANEADTDRHPGDGEMNSLKDEKSGTPAVKNKQRQFSILLVEDNDDFRFYLKDNLKEYFTIVEAADGKQGWQKALAAHPDLVVSDISMPEMNGIDLCKKIKADKRTSHIPVILLTALTGEDQQIKGLETGANDYVTKPFNFEIVLSKIKNLLSQQSQFKKAVQKQVEVGPSEVVVESPNEKFMKQLMEMVEKNISEPDFSVEDMSRGMYMSRVALYKKLLALTGKSPVEFLRQIRVKRAAQLLGTGEMTISEVAYEVGFNNPRYLSKHFKAEYGVLPSVFLDDLKKDGEAELSKP